MNQQNILIGMSGGVDSSVAAHRMVCLDIPCTGATLRLHDFGCGGDQDARDAAAVAARLGIPHEIIEAKDIFSATVIQNFVESYEAGLTPNPCIQCNFHLKFGAMLQWALDHGFTHVVSGHYAQIRQDAATGRYLLYKAADAAKDQTYFLASLTQNQLAHILFPLGSLTKAEVRAIAEAQGFLTARKRDSQDICFIPDGDYAAFLSRQTGKTYPEGNFLDREGKTVGRHQGAVRYTLGQRKGLGLAMGAPVYVCGKDMENNTVTVGPNEALFSKALRAKNMNYFPFPELTEPMAVTAKIRHSQTEHPAILCPEAEGCARVEFETPQRAVTPGQAVVLYQGDLVIAGGTIAEVL